ncbi:unnamed protein product [Linum trigynum]|uniref:Uncharacterized protein n=1 Tax=Linum trigynum TaxID=586398 RepID=A0AAV2G6P1_9ROSI
MGYYWTARAADMRSLIQHPQFPANNFEVSTSVITMLRGSVVYRRKQGECPRSHLWQFHELIDGIKINGVPADAIQLIEGACASLKAEDKCASQKSGRLMRFP